jgi:hypothetical protein
MAFPRSMSLMRHASLLGCVAFTAAGLVYAQSTTIQDSSSQPAAYSSSQQGLSDSDQGPTEYELAEFALPSAPNPASAAGGAGQYGNGGGYGGGEKHKLLHNWTFEAGGGFNAPLGNDTPYITWGGNFTAGGGLRFSDRLSVLAEYQFMDNKLPGGLIAAVNSGCSDCGVTGGNAHINAITGSPVFDLTPKWSNGIYVVGGFGYYHKSTNFQSPEEAFDPYYGYY